MNKYFRRFRVFFLAYLMITVITIGAVTVYAASKTLISGKVGGCACDKEKSIKDKAFGKNAKATANTKCKICNIGTDICSNQFNGTWHTVECKCFHKEIMNVTGFSTDKLLSIVNTTGNTFHDVSCSKHPTLRAYGCNRAVYNGKVANKNIKALEFVDGTSCAKGKGAKYWSTFGTRNNSMAAAYLSQTGKKYQTATQDGNNEAKSYYIDGDNRVDKKTGKVTGKADDQDKGGKSNESNSGELKGGDYRFDKDKVVAFDYNVPYDKKLSDLYDYSALDSELKGYKSYKKGKDRKVADTIFFNACEGETSYKGVSLIDGNGTKGKGAEDTVDGVKAYYYTASDDSKYICINIPADVLIWGESATDKTKKIYKSGTKGMFMDFIAKDGTTVHGVTFSIAVGTYEYYHEKGAKKGNQGDADTVKKNTTRLYTRKNALVSNLPKEVQKRDWDTFHVWNIKNKDTTQLKQGISIQKVSNLDGSTKKAFEKWGFDDKTNPIVKIRFYANKDDDDFVKASSKDVVTKGNAVSSDNSDGGNDGSGNKSAIEEAGFYSEEALSSFTKLVEPELTDQVANSDKSALTQEETEGLSDWQMNVARSKEHKGIATWINYILTVIGVLLIIWGSVFYMAYWFDMINPFVDLDLVSRLSLGRFTVSHELDGSCTWSLTKHTEGRGTRQQTINSKVALFISVCAIAIGVLIISGGLYRIVRSIYYGGAVLFHQIFG